MIKPEDLFINQSLPIFKGYKERSLICKRAVKNKMMGIGN